MWKEVMSLFESREQLTFSSSISPEKQRMAVFCILQKEIKNISKSIIFPIV